MYIGFLNYNKIFDIIIDILNLETGCSKICDDFDHGVHVGNEFNKMADSFEVDFGLFYLIDAVKGKKISIFLQI